MSHAGPRGCMGWSSNDHPVTIELIHIWNKLGVLDGFIYSEYRKEPEHLKKLSEAIEVIREHLKEK